MTGDRPAVSIGMPIYNGERFLRITLDSILSQTFTDFGLIISDNASTDGTYEICRDYARKDPRIRFHRNDTNIGAAKNFNLVFEKSTGKYFRWSSADDVFAPESLRRCVDVLEAHPQVVLCYPKTVLIDENGNIIRPYEDNLDLRSPQASTRFREGRRRIGLVNAHYGLIRAQVLRKTALLRGYPGSDVPLLLEIALHGQFWEIPEPLFYRRMHPGASSTVTKESVERAQQFMDPSTTGQLFLRYWRHHYDCFTAVLRSPLTGVERMRLFYIIVRSGITSRRELATELHAATRYLFLSVLSGQRGPMRPVAYRKEPTCLPNVKREP